MNKIRIPTIVLLVVLFSFYSHSSAQLKEIDNTFYVASWNVENLFDTFNDPNTTDEDFLPESDKQWTADRFEQKLVNLAKVINYMNDGCGPDVLGLVEVENINVLKWLIYKFKDRDYIIAHRDSPDQRGIDAALIFDRKVFGIVDIDTIRVNIPTGTPTRYIFHVILKYLRDNSIVHFFVNHWPSRRGGEVKSEQNRIAAAKVLKGALEKIFEKDKNANIIMMGDFNDEPTDKSITKILAAVDFDCEVKKNNSALLNLSYKTKLKGEGSYLFGSTWNMIDQMIISPSLNDGKEIEYVCNSFSVIKPEFMIAKEGDKKNGPLPTYSGNRYLGGYSDHFPISAKFILLEEKK